MNKEETLALSAQGKAAWNDWARGMLDRRAEMEKAGTWAATRNTSANQLPHSEATDEWLAAAEANFAGHIFEEGVDFHHWLFPGSANFKKATFNRGADFSDVTSGGLAMFDEATFSGDAGFEIATFSGFAGFFKATFSGDARFGEATFSGDAWFANATFSGKAGFFKATFSGDAWFGDATFSGDAGFVNATFGGAALFANATFSGDAWFGDATFSGGAWFEIATFSGAARFEIATFSRLAQFDAVTFKGKASFAAAQAESGFSLAGARFAEVPDFIQGHFKEAPRLDDVRIRAGKADGNLSARFRALKRLAIQGHDHAREQEYFAGELKALRGHPDRLMPNPLNWFRKDQDGRRRPVWPGGARYWFGIGYQWFSDFGRSMLRPLVWWLLAVPGFGFAYLHHHFVRAVETDRGYFAGFWAWLWGSIAQPLMDWFPGLGGSLPTPAAVPSPTCLVGDGNPFSAAIGLSIRKALPFAGVGSSEKLNQIYACLYGVHGAALKGSPVIPDVVDYLGIVQLLFSLLLLFLFLLAVRNHFRIK